VTYTSSQGAPAPRAVTTVVVAPQQANKLFDVGVILQAGDSNSPAYTRDVQTILSGMKITTPAQP
jgi:hypothetical protein